MKKNKFIEERREKTQKRREERKKKLKKRKLCEIAIKTTAKNCNA